MAQRVSTSWPRDYRIPSSSSWGGATVKSRVEFRHDECRGQRLAAVAGRAWATKQWHQRICVLLLARSPLYQARQPVSFAALQWIDRWTFLAPTQVLVVTMEFRNNGGPDGGERCCCDARLRRTAGALPGRSCLRAWWIGRWRTIPALRVGLAEPHPEQAGRCVGVVGTLMSSGRNSSDYEDRVALPSRRRISILFVGDSFCFGGPTSGRPCRRG
jgi:hypothetical protein